ncbi:FAD-binding domain-containing protein [Roseobacter weihaiensis]|uniref:FAD-binding domain-containing protein n=1 Tax=Roseobacter weihaiensis TaxID=2763262 RepID=UPI001D0AA45B|nr:FAD-binding domain-containing protein [Roseobacter sp. H9]
MTDGFIPTRTAALERLAAFVPHAGRDYAAKRNFDLGAGGHVHVSGLSPYLRCRLLTEAEVLQAVLARHSPRSTEKFVQEVFWRTYWKGWLALRPGVWTQYRTALSQAWNDVQTQSGLRSRWEQACHGATGIDCFDAWAQELVATGYLHNHARMWFASIWIFTLKLPWELGADFFLRHLLDGDPASNTLGWRWVAGIQTPGKTYLARASNIAKFTKDRFHPKWQLASEALPVPGLPVPDPGALPVPETADPTARIGFLLHEEDLSPSFALEGLSPQACAVLRPQTDIGPLQMAPQVHRFRAAAQDDVLARYADRFPQVTSVTTAEDVMAWATKKGVEQIVTCHAPTGPVAAVFSDLQRNTTDIRLHQIMRPYDQMTWPHATRGFFAFKKKIPSFLSELSLPHAA